MRLIPLVLVFLLAACQHSQHLDDIVKTSDFTDKSGWVSVFQTKTSDTETTINILRPRLAPMAYVVDIDRPDYDLGEWESRVQKVLKTTEGPHIHWAMDRIHVKDLRPGQSYRLSVVNKRYKKVVDWRRFKTIDLKQKKAKFIVGSCMSDSHAFEHVRNRIWGQMLTHNADFLVLLGDEVYVDDYDFVKRGQVTEFDLWTRYIDSFRKTPLFQSRQLIPIFAIWDDHDYGTNNSDRTFKSKKAAKKVFNAFFGSEPIPHHFDVSKNQIYFSFQGYGQKFLFMDDRYYRNPDAQSKYGQWGEAQHQWFRKQIKTATGPIWLANGGQFFTKATTITQDNGKKKQINETFVDDHPRHFKTLMNDIKQAKHPVVFLSGDIHYSEVVGIEPELLGYQTYEFTSSPLHSYIFRSKAGEPESWLDNPRRLISVKEHNYLLIDSEASSQGLSVRARSFGVKQKKPYFDQSYSIKNSSF